MAIEHDCRFLTKQPNRCACAKVKEQSPPLQRTGRERPLPARILSIVLAVCSVTAPGASLILRQSTGA